MWRMSAPKGTQAAVRAIGLLKAFTDIDPELSLTELCQRMDLTKTTAHRLLGALESEGLIARNERNGRYKLGIGLLDLGARSLRSNDLRDRVRPALEWLKRQTGETATLEIAIDGHVLILDELPTGHLVSATGNIGSRWPLHATSSGKALLAVQPDLWEQLPESLRQFTAHTINSRERLRRQAETVLSAGYAVASEELEEGYSAVAAPLFNALGDVEGAISLGGPTTRMKPRGMEYFGRLVAQAAAQCRKGFLD
jgi:IclR family acetate operon transcriptional repressor